ncbi:MAG: adenylosuccinate lyase [Dehalococcoidales bacterium]|nr:adenylosuccinate lyase [Dehalococcoidales bacterium]MDP7109785.1 adenylosuccinate lyase [Dehalococcoidales bacterium]MDP7310247.1 adenylosuccinate lyase [Dehalococcoidales bacterium]MDP7409239.1 adenylosuccinate lyase [Dehalococcoidales bacterium]MDP7675573.1 adenylosuccinate lyase [Dehalococcoidales bacterium]
MIKRYSRPQMRRVWSDENKFRKWLEVEIAVCEAWAELGVIPKKALPKLKLARLNLKRMEEILKETHHDVTAFLNSISESLGEESRFIHLGLTSSDVMDTALSLQLVEAAELLNQDMKELISVLAEKALKHKYTVMMGRTHGVHAEPITFGLKLALWIDEMNRNRRRLNEATKAIAVGKISGAVGTYATLSLEVEEKACARLKLASAPVSSQILPRDCHAQFVTMLATISASLEKFATEIRGLQRTETREVEEPFAVGQTGSSAMPHKRNPELCERVCGLARLVRGFALTSLENIALWHERDISHSSTERIIFPDACLVVDYSLDVFTSVMRGLQVYPQRMKHNMKLTKGLIFSQRVMLALIDKGSSRQKAYEQVQRNAMKSWRTGRNFLTLLKADPEVTASLPPEELDKLFDYQYYLRYIDDIFHRLGLTESQWQEKINRSSELAPKKSRR